MKKELKLNKLDFTIKEENFALNLDASSAYETNAVDMYRAAMIGENSVRGRFKQVLGVKDRVKLGTTVFSNLIKAGACTFDPSDADLSQKTFEVCPIMIGTAICVDSLETSFVSDQLARGSASFTEPQPFMNYFYETLSATLAEELSYLSFRGDSSLTGDTYLKACDGLETVLAASTGVTTPSTASTVTSANVIAKMIEARSGVSAAVKAKSDFVYIVSTNVWEALMDAVSDNKNSGLYYVEGINLRFQGVEVVRADEASDNVIIATYLSNLLNISDLESDVTGFNVVDFMQTLLDRKIGIRTDAKVSFDFLVAGDIFFHKP